MTQLSGPNPSTNQLKFPAAVLRSISFWRVVGWRPPVEFDARVRRHSGAGAEQVVLLHAFAIEFVAGARVLDVAVQISRPVDRRR